MSSDTADEHIQRSQYPGAMLGEVAYCRSQLALGNSGQLRRHEDKRLSADLQGGRQRASDERQIAPSEAPYEISEGSVLLNIFVITPHGFGIVRQPQDSLALPDRLLDRRLECCRKIDLVAAG